jgi:hypothetical protein
VDHAGNDADLASTGVTTAASAEHSFWGLDWLSVPRLSRALILGITCAAHGLNIPTTNRPFPWIPLQRSILEFRLFAANNSGSHWGCSMRAADLMRTGW